MSQINDVKGVVDKKDLFSDLSGPTYVRLMDTPRIWGEPFDKRMMPSALARTREFEEVVVEVIQKTKYRCDVASLNSPDPSWTKVILEAMDIALSTKMNREGPTQFRFLFGQTPMILTTGTPPNLIDFQGSLIRLVRERSHAWERVPEIWVGKFFRLQEGIISGIGAYAKSLVKEYTPSVIGDYLISDAEEGASTKMTWNHAKIVASDGTEALVGGHNLNMDLFTSYPPVHDVSVVVHGGAAYGAQLYLNRMWECKTNIFTKARLDVSDISAPEFKELNDDDAPELNRRPADPLSAPLATTHREARYKRLAEIHGGPIAKESSGRGSSVKASVKEEVDDGAESIRAEDLQTLVDLEEPVFEEGTLSDSYVKLSEYKKATRVLSVGKYWTGPDMRTDYKAASELMKQNLILNARRSLKLSQMDLISAWKKKWESHVVCHWIMEALLKNKDLIVQVVVSPLNAGAGAEGDQYSFGSGACRTFDLFRYYSLHTIDDKPLDDRVERLTALDRFHIAPLFFTDVPAEHATEGETYFWPDLDPKGWTQTIKQPSLFKQPPRNGVIGDAVEAVKMAGALDSKYKKVESAPGNHAKVMIVDDEAYVVGSDNLYPGFLSEFNYLIEGKDAVCDLLESYWNPLWHYSSQHCVNPDCRKGCKGKGSEYRPSKPKVRAVPRIVLPDMDVPLTDRHNVGKVRRIDLAALPEEEAPKKELEPLKGKSDKGGLGKGSSNKVTLDDEDSLLDDFVLVESSKGSSSGELSLAEKEKRAQAARGQGVFELDDEAPDLTVAGYYFTENDIYNLQRYYLRNSPNIAVIEGVIFFQWEEMNRLAYTTDIHPAITTATDTIVQAFHVGGNHWALLYITLGPAGDDGIRPAKLLYCDPLNPNAVPVNRLSLLGHPFPGIQAEHSLIKYQNDRSPYGQNSCGAWVVHLAKELAAHPHRLPAADADPHLAALRMREEMNDDLEAARAHPRPVAPVNRQLWVQAPPVVARPRVLARRGSLDDMGKLKKKTTLIDF